MKVVIVGAGYAGTIAANRLSKQVKDAQITVINPRPWFVERVRLHEQLAGSGTASTDLEQMLGPGIETCIGTAQRLGDGIVRLADGGELPFDYAVVAVGSHAEPLADTIPVATWEGAERARAAIDALKAGSTVTVIGSGLTGIETAAELAESRADLEVRIIGGRIGPSLSAAARTRAVEGLRRLGVEVVVGKVGKVIGASTLVTGHAARRGGTIVLASGERLSSDVSLWAIISGVPDLAYDSNLTVDAEGRAVVDPSLRSVSDPNIFVIGDCAAVPGARMACATAMPQGAHAADALARVLSGREPKPYAMGYVGQCVSLGRRDGLVQLVRRDDSPRKLHIAGRPAAFVKEQICRYARRGAGGAAYTWIKGGGRPIAAPARDNGTEVQTR